MVNTFKDQSSRLAKVRDTQSSRRIVSKRRNSRHSKTWSLPSAKRPPPKKELLCAARNTMRELCYSSVRTPCHLCTHIQYSWFTFFPPGVWCQGDAFCDKRHFTPDHVTFVTLASAALVIEGPVL